MRLNSLNKLAVISHKVERLRSLVALLRAIYPFKWKPQMSSCLTAMDAALNHVLVSAIAQCACSNSFPVYVYTCQIL